MTARPDCRVCGAPVDRLQRTPSNSDHDRRFAIAAAYPCGHWHTPLQARAVAAQARQLHTEENETR
jgi:hypothetical protein